MHGATIKISWLYQYVFILCNILIVRFFSVIQRIPSAASVKLKVSASSGKLHAPLAGVEEITPSLRSSFGSVYYNITPYESTSSINSANSGTE